MFMLQKLCVAACTCCRLPHVCIRLRWDSQPRANNVNYRSLQMWEFEGMPRCYRKVVCFGYSTAYCSEITIITLHVCLVRTHLVNLHFIDINWQLQRVGGQISYDTQSDSGQGVLQDRCTDVSSVTSSIIRLQLAIATLIGWVIIKWLINNNTD